ncbi:MAG: hypothetical protein ACJA2A_002043 [Cycloclasticus pugetii]|jgi:hypothetical protein
MAGDTINVEGAWATLQAAASTANGAMSAGARTDIVTALGATEAAYPLIDFKVSVSVGTPTLNGKVHIFRRSKADTDESPAPTSAYLSERVASIKMSSTASSHYYAYGIPNFDKNATYYIQNSDGANTLTLALKARARSYNTN